MYGHMIPGQDDDTARNWEERHQRNRPASQQTRIMQ
jgi:hypothetical protein